MKSSEIRKKFLRFFENQGHTRVASSSLIPAEDPTLLFANAGMNQFKDVFLGREKRSYTRATSIQKCMRAGGKHDDLQQVGFTKRHLTFFEMMGNFSFGDYFKKEAIQFAWDFLTKEMKFDPETMYASVYEKDDESYDLWHTMIGVPKERIVRLGAFDNFWQMGDTGPCGPCSEIYVDRGTEYGCGKKNCAPGCDCDRFLEVWNLVFMQFDRQPDGTDVPLKQTGVDTGMGFERLCVVMQDAQSVFNIDVFKPIIDKIQELSGVMYKEQDEETQAAFHVLADHIRAASFLIADGASPSNDGRGYVLRKIIRRAALFAKKLTDKSIFPQLAEVVIEDMGDIYPELVTNHEQIKALLTSEIERFASNLEHGSVILQQYLDEAKKTKKITGQQAFKLYDTYGFPLELTLARARQMGYSVDEKGFEKLMEEQRKRSGKKMKEAVDTLSLPEGVSSDFTGYDEIKTASNITAIIVGTQPVQDVKPETMCWVIAEQSPFYVEKGGQVSDAGIIHIHGTDIEVLDLKRIDGAIAHKIKSPVPFAVGDKINLLVDKKYRDDTRKNHTATHLLQSALIQLFGKQIKQSGSLVAPDYLRFDFTYHENLSPEQIKQVEDIVNETIWENIPVSTVETTYKDAIAKGVIAFFGEKYNPESVRMVDVPGFSAELCGGTHVRATGDIGCFKITEVSALSAGQRRIVAVTGPKALELFQQDFDIVKVLCQGFSVQPHELVGAIQKQRETVKDLQKEVKKIKQQMRQAQIPSMVSQVEMLGNVPFLFVDLPDASVDELRDLGTNLQKNKPGFYFLISSSDKASQFFATIDPATGLDLNAFAQWLKDEAKLRGGARKGTIQGGGPRISESLKDMIIKWIKK